VNPTSARLLQIVLFTGKSNCLGKSIARAIIKQPKILIFDEATSSLDSATAEHFAATINQLKGKVTMLFITHAMPKNLLVDEVVRIGQGVLAAVDDAQDGTELRGNR
jgi:subfamily B ATP-binding cassette protein HlyB/CyaB